MRKKKKKLHYKEVEKEVNLTELKFEEMSNKELECFKEKVHLVMRDVEEFKGMVKRVNVETFEEAVKSPPPPMLPHRSFLQV